MRLRLVLAGRSEALLYSPALPAPWLGRVEAWLKRETAELLEGARFDVDSQGRPNLFLRLHPAADDVSFAAAGGGRFVVAANTYTVGPGYHRYLCDLLRRLGEEFQIVWADPDAENQVGDPTGYFHSHDASALEQNMLAWLSDAAGQALALHRAGQGNVALSLRFGHAFDSQAPLLTPMGPRDLSWLKAVHADPRSGMDVFPWWEEGTRGATQLGRAMTRLWTEMVWRPPLLEEERKLFRDVAVRLAAAYRDDPSLDFPWSEWRDLLGYLGMGGTLSEEVSRRAASKDTDHKIGYRRRPVRVLLEQGWSLRIPGSLAESLLPSKTWVGRDHRRTIRFTPLEPATGAPQLPEGAVSTSIVEHRGARVRSRAMVRTGGGACSLIALCHSGDRRALCAITSEDPEDHDWMMETWRSIDMLPLA
ncbi:MAG: hypothetical protein M3Y59_16155 [Myxococcota bacterium]|nr:hypothetical protein [Myxococcota bacterium]